MWAHFYIQIDNEKDNMSVATTMESNMVLGCRDNRAQAGASVSKGVNRGLVIKGNDGSLVGGYC